MASQILPEDSASVAERETILQQLPELNLAHSGHLPALCSLAPDELEAVEISLENTIREGAARIANGEIGVASIGRGRFEIVSSEEATLLRRERVEGIPRRDSGNHKLNAALREEVAIFSTLGTAELSSHIASELGIPHGVLDVKQFKDGELSLSVGANVRDRDVFIVAGTSMPVNEQLMELCITVDALKRSSARRITLVAPYLGYSRQDKKLRGREPISAKLVAKLLETAGVDRIVTLDIHSDQSIGFFDIPIDNLRASSILIPYLRRKFANDSLVVVSPDKGGVPRASAYATELDAPLAMIHKTRTEANKVEKMTLLGSVRGKTCLIVDDMIDTGGTLIKAAEMLMKAGATRVVACCVHPVLSGDAVERLRSSEIEELVTTDTIPLRRARGTRITVVSTAGLLAEGIRRMVYRESLTTLALSEVDDSHKLD